MNHLILKKQEIPFPDRQSTNLFVPKRNKPFVATRNAVDVFGETIILEKLCELQILARQHHGLDYLQVFTSQNGGKDLWFIEDGEGGAITALLPEDH